MKRGRTLSELFSFPCFTPERRLKGKMGDAKARIVTLRRRGKKEALFMLWITLLPLLRQFVSGGARS